MMPNPAPTGVQPVGIPGYPAYPAQQAPSEQRVIAASAWQPASGIAPQPLPVGGPELDDTPTLGEPRIVPMTPGNPFAQPLPPAQPVLQGQPPFPQPQLHGQHPFQQPQLQAQPVLRGQQGSLTQPAVQSTPMNPAGRRKGTMRPGRPAFASLTVQQDRERPRRDTPADREDTLPSPRKLPDNPPVAPNNDPRPPIPYTPAAYTFPPNVPREFQKQALPPYVVEPPDILLIQGTQAIALPSQPLEGQFLVRPDGTIGLGIYGSLIVAGKTLEQIRQMVALALSVHLKKMTLEQIMSELQVDVLSYNSKFYYVITSGAGYGEQVYPFLSTGNETVLDAMAKINGLPPVANKKHIWVARATLDPAHPKILPVDWCGIAKRGSGLTNYQIFPGDRIYVDSDPWLKTDTYISKRLSPILRLFGATLLGATTVNTIKGTPGGIGSNGITR